jgi:hypothetical protein
LQLGFWLSIASEQGCGKTILFVTTFGAAISVASFFVVIILALVSAIAALCFQLFVFKGWCKWVVLVTATAKYTVSKMTTAGAKIVPHLAFKILEISMGGNASGDLSGPRFWPLPYNMGGNIFPETSSNFSHEVMYFSYTIKRH